MMLLSFNICVNISTISVPSTTVCLYSTSAAAPNSNKKKRSKKYKTLAHLSDQNTQLNIPSFSSVPVNLANYTFSEMLNWLFCKFSQLFRNVEITARTSSSFFVCYCDSIVDFFNRIFVANSIPVQVSVNACSPAVDTPHQVIFEQIRLASADWIKILFYSPLYKSIPLNWRCFILLVLIVTSKTQHSSVRFDFLSCVSTQLVLVPTDGNASILLDLVRDLNAVSEAKKLL